MNVSVRSCLSSGVAVASVGALVMAPTMPEEAPIRTGPPAISRAAWVQPLMTPPPVPSPQQVLGRLNEQAAFHVDLAVDFVAQGASLVNRQIPVPFTLLSDIQNGTPLSVAVSRALTTLAEVEVDAGKQLVGFAARIVDFQLQFVASALQGAVVMTTAVPAAVGELVASTLAGLTPPPGPVSITSSDTVTTSTTRFAQAESSDRDTLQQGTEDATGAKSATDTIHSDTPDSDSEQTTRAEVRSDTPESTDAINEADSRGSDSGHEATTDSDTTTDRDNAPEGNDTQRQQEAAPKPDGQTGDETGNSSSGGAKNDSNGNDS
jgi:hypothetical protein